LPDSWGALNSLGMSPRLKDRTLAPLRYRQLPPDRTAKTSNATWRAEGARGPVSVLGKRLADFAKEFAVSPDRVERGPGRAKPHVAARPEFPHSGFGAIFCAGGFPAVYGMPQDCRCFRTGVVQEPGSLCFGGCRLLPLRATDHEARVRAASNVFSHTLKSGWGMAAASPRPHKHLRRPALTPVTVSPTMT